MIDYLRTEAERRQERIDRVSLDGKPGLSVSEPYSDRRRDPRYEVTAKVELTVFFPVSEGSVSGSRLLKVRRTGFTRDLSRRGAGIVIDSEIEPFPFRKLVGRDAKVKLQIAGEEKALNVLGRVTWCSEQHGVTALGLEFTEIPESERRILENHCREDDGEQARILNLWQVLVAEEVQHGD